MYKTLPVHDQSWVGSSKSKSRKKLSDSNLNGWFIFNNSNNLDFLLIEDLSIGVNEDLTKSPFGNSITESNDDIIIDLRNLNEKPKNTYDVLKHSNIPNSFSELKKIVLLCKAVSVVDLETLKKLKTFTFDKRTNV